MNCTRSLITIAAIIFSIDAYSQSSPDSIKRYLEDFSKAFPQEKLYVHLDKPYYSPGDTIWFKAYLTDAAAHLADSVSKVIYVDLFRKDNGRLIRHKLLYNESGFANGEFYLSDSLTAGRYELVGYTNWMRNFPGNFFFRKEIIVYRVADIKQRGQEDIAQSQRVADFQFFPEGGNMIAGLQNRVAFKAVNQYGEGVDVKAFILSEKKDTLAAVTSQHLGMGSFVFKPKAEERYFAVLEKSSEQKHFALPEVTASGYTFIVDNLTNKDQVKVTARNNYPVKDRPILIGHQRGNIVFGFQSEKEGNSFSWTLPKANIPDNGIVQLTLFNGQGVPQCERLIFHHDESPLQISITTDKVDYLPYEKVTLSINVKDEDGNPVSGNFSLSVTDSAQVTPESNGGNIYNYLYLTSDVQELTNAGVKGSVEQPAYYFNDANLSARVHLDILLMTQGWRRFLWRDVLEHKNSTQQFDIEQGISVHGKAVLANGKKPGKPLGVSLFYSEENASPKYLNATTDPSGNFVFSGIEANRETTLFIQGLKDNGGRNITLSVDKPDFPTYQSSGEVNPFLFDNELFRSFLQHHSRMAEIDANVAISKAKVLEEVEVKAHREKKSDPRRVMYEGTNATTVVVDAQMCATAQSILQLIQGRVAGVEVRQNSSGGFIVQMRGPKSLVQRNPEVVGVLVDGVLMDLQMLSTIPPCSVESIDVITHPVSMLNVPGLISVLTKGGSSSQRDWTKVASSNASAPGTVTAKIQGFDIPKEFYSPKYPLTANPSTDVPDFRSTIFWSPDIKTGLDGNAKVIFWNSGEHTSIQIALEGITLTGKPGYASHYYVVK